jgi:hypothetical protein
LFDRPSAKSEDGTPWGGYRRPLPVDWEVVESLPGAFRLAYFKKGGVSGRLYLRIVLCLQTETIREFQESLLGVGFALQTRGWDVRRSAL